MRDDIVVDQSPIVSQYMPPKPATARRVSTSVPNPGGASSADTSSNKLNRKQILLQQNFELKRKYESMVLEWIEILCDPVSEATLGEAVRFFDIVHSKKHTNMQTPLTFILTSLGKPTQTITLPGSH